MTDLISFVDAEVGFSNRFLVMEPYSEKTNILLVNIEVKKQKQIFYVNKNRIVRNQEKL